MRHSFALLAVGAFAATLSGAAQADPIDDAIKARQSFYQVVFHNAGALFAMAKGDVEYNAEQATIHAKNLEMLSQMNNGTMWPGGSSKADKPGKTRALPVIWETYPAVTEKSKAWKAAVATLAGSAGNGLDALRKDIGPLGASCKGCHDTYRAKDF